MKSLSAIIVARGLVKRYGNFTAVDGISFEVEEGEALGLLGPNGAGKTTTIRLICGLSPPTAGELLVDGLDVRRHARQVKRRLGIVPQHDNLDPELTVRQNLLAYSRYYDLPRPLAEARIREALALFQLLDYERQRIETLSVGLRRRLIIARALVNAPRILVLDEPTIGLDPQARRLTWEKLRQLQARGTTLLLTTHYLEEAAHLCDRLLIIHQGRVLAEGRPAELVERYAGRRVIEVYSSNPDEEERIRRLLADRPGVEMERDSEALYIYLRRDDGLDLAPFHRLGQRVVLREANLEDVFLRLTGRGLQR